MCSRTDASNRRLRIGIAGPVSLGVALPGLDSRALPQSYDSAMVAQIARELADRGHQVVLFTTSTDLDRPVVLRDGNVEAHVVPRRRSGVVRNLYGQERRWLKSAILDARPDVLEAQWTYEFAWAAIASGIPTAVMVRDDAYRVLRLEPNAFRAVRFVMDRITRLRAHTMIANSAYTRGSLSPRNAADAPALENFVGPVVARVAAEGSAPHARPYIVTVVNGFSRLKNLERGLEAFASARESIAGVDYVLVGRDSEPGGSVARFARSRGLDQAVVFAGTEDYTSTLRWIRDASVLFHPSLEESFGNTVLEAMALGTTVLGGKHSGNVPMLLGGGAYGMLVDVTDPAEMADGLSTLINDEMFRSSLAAAAKARADEHYSAERCIALHEHVLRTLVEGD